MRKRLIDAIRVHYTHKVECILKEIENLDVFSSLILKLSDLYEKYFSRSTSFDIKDSYSEIIGFANYLKLLEQYNYYNCSPLHLAVIKTYDVVKADDGSIIDMLTSSKQFDIETKEFNGYTPLHLAVRLGKYHVIKLLLEKNANPNSIDNEQKSPLHMAAKCSPDIVELLLDNGADVNMKVGHIRYLSSGYNSFREDSREGYWTPIFIASRYNNDELIHLLLERGANINARDSLGRTPLHIAALFASRKAIEFLLENGADINSIDCVGRTPLHTLVSYKYSYDIDFLAIKLLLEKGAKIDKKDVYGQTALDSALQLQKIASINELLKYGAVLSHQMQCTAKTMYDNSKSCEKISPEDEISIMNIAMLIHQVDHIFKNFTILKKSSFENIQDNHIRYIAKYVVYRFNAIYGQKDAQKYIEKFKQLFAVQSDNLPEDLIKEIQKKFYEFIDTSLNNMQYILHSYYKEFSPVPLNILIMQLEKGNFDTTKIKVSIKKQIELYKKAGFVDKESDKCGMLNSDIANINNCNTLKGELFLLNIKLINSLTGKNITISQKEASLILESSNNLPKFLKVKILSVLEVVNILDADGVIIEEQFQKKLESGLECLSLIIENHHEEESEAQLMGHDDSN